MLNASSTFLTSLVSWDVFATLTYRESPPSLDTAIIHGLAWVDMLRVLQRLPVSDFYWILRPERGEVGGRLHLHALLRVLPAYKGWFVVPQGCISYAHRAWNRGRTQFRYVEGREDPAVLYLQKLEKGSGSDRYEIGKTASSRDLVFAPALTKRAGLQKSETNIGGRISAGKHTEVSR